MTASLDVSEVEVAAQRVLVFGADDSMETEIAQAIEASGWSVVSSHDADYIRVLVTLESFSFIIVDIKHAHDTGDTVARWILKNAPEQRVVIVAHEPGIRSAIELMQLGAVDYLPKPLRLDRLVSLFGLSSPSKRRSQLAHVSMKVPEEIAGYEVIDAIGEGMSSVVFEVRVNGQRQALKLFKSIDSDERREQEMTDRFIREAEILLEIRHPNVVHAYDVGFTPLDTGKTVPYIAMEFVDGTTLLDATGPNATMMDIPKRTAIMARVANGLQAIHDAGIIHRDVKPNNIVVSRTGEVKLMDLGVAHLTSSSLTRPGDYLGTPAYMAPEAFQDGHWDYRADIFSLGVTAYYFLTYELPYRATSVAQYLQTVQLRQPTHPSEYIRGFPRCLTRILAGMLDRNPARRYQRAADVALDLNAYSQNPAISADDLPCGSASNLWISTGRD